jgi:hypothetical protein
MSAVQQPFRRFQKQTFPGARFKNFEQETTPANHQLQVDERALSSLSGAGAVGK